MARKKPQPAQPDNDLSIVNRQYIEKYYLEKSPRIIAAYLEKDVAVITAYIDKNLMSARILNSDNYRQSAQLRALPEWYVFNKAFTPDEMIIFEQTYLEYQEQFSDDILATEREQVLQSIKLKLLMQRNEISQANSGRDIERIQRDLDDEYDKSPGDRDIDKINILIDQVNGIKSAINASRKDYMDLLKAHRDIYDKLKATRAQRIDEISNANTNFIGMIKELEKKTNREKQATYMELGKQALHKKLNHLSQLHTYKNGDVDIPVLNADNVSQIEYSDQKVIDVNFKEI